MRATRLGLAVPIEGLGFRESLEVAIDAFGLGYTDAWSYEVSGSDGFTPVAWLAGRAPGLRLGISLIPAFTRPPALLAMSCASVAHLSDGRFVLGLGGSSPALVGAWMGLAHEHPLTRVRETVEVVRLALTGEKVSYQGSSVRVENFRLDLAPVTVPIVFGALGPKMFRLSGAIADGVITVFNTVQATPMLLSDVAAGAREQGRDPGDLEVIGKLFVAIDEDGPELRQMLRRFVTGYGTVPAYNSFLARQGFDAQASEMAAAWAEGRRADAMRAVGDELLEALIVFGSGEACVQRLQAYARAGITTLLIAPITAATDPVERRRRLTRTVAVIAGALGTRRSDPAGVAVDERNRPRLY